MAVHKIIIKIKNDHWYQAGKYLIMKHMDKFKAHQICIIEDEDIVKDIKQIAKDHHHSDESFIALETNFKLQNSPSSK